MKAADFNFLDCTLRDGGYYNSWDFSPDLIKKYLDAMQFAGVDIVELGFRSLNKQGYRGASAFTTDEFLHDLKIPKNLDVGVMINGSDLIKSDDLEKALHKLFPNDSSVSPVTLVRIACRIDEFGEALPASQWLKDNGFKVGFNLMQIADCSEAEIKELALLSLNYPLDVLYFADSMGAMKPEDISRIVQLLRSEWNGAIGIHTHDNMGLALSNTLKGLDDGVTWIDSTVTGMGRGPGNARTEELAIEVADRRGNQLNMIPLMRLIQDDFKPMQDLYGWGSNPYYYLAGKYGIHPSFIQEMLGDSRYSEEDLLSVIDQLRNKSGKRFSRQTLANARGFFSGTPSGRWSPYSEFSERDVLILGSGPGVKKHRTAIERFIKNKKPVVLAINTQSSVDSSLIDFRVACHPIRLFADCLVHKNLEQPLIAPFSMLPTGVQEMLRGKEILDFGVNVCLDSFSFNDTYCTIPALLVVCYALCIATSGGASKVFLAGFDGYGADDQRTLEMCKVLERYQDLDQSLPVTAITPTRYGVHSQSVYAL